MLLPSAPGRHDGCPDRPSALLRNLLLTSMNASSNATPVEVSTFRLYLLRATYLLIAVGLALMIWPLILRHPADVPHMNGVVRSVLGAVALLAVLGIRYPLKMLPLLFFELVWKCIWVLAFGLPLWSADQLDPATSQTMFDCLFGIFLVLVILPWRYVFTQYVRVPGERWRRQSELIIQ